MKWYKYPEDKGKLVSGREYIVATKCWDYKDVVGATFIDLEFDSTWVKFDDRLTGVYAFTEMPYPPDTKE